MKTKDIVYLIIAVVIFAVAGYLLFTILVPSKPTAASNLSNQAEVVGTVDDKLNYSVVSELSDTTKNVDYTVNLDLNTGVGNPSVFGH
jgi:flagellar basal body-associated protein FliL